MAFVKKIRLFIIYVFWANQARKDRFLVILDKKIFSTPKKKLLKKSKNSKFSKRVSPWFLSKNRTFCHLCLLGKSSQKRSFFGILDKKECFLDQKKEVLKNDKNQHFPKGLVHSFCQRIELSIICVFWANQDRKDRFGLLDKKERPLKQKKEVLKTLKFEIFQRG